MFFAAIENKVDPVGRCHFIWGLRCQELRSLLGNSGEISQQVALAGGHRGRQSTLAG